MLCHHLGDHARLTSASQPHLYHPTDARALHAACHVHRHPPDVVLRLRGADHACDHRAVSNACG